VSLTRTFLLATGVLLVGFGLAYLVTPVAMSSLADLVPATPLAVIEVRGFYGGQLVGLGAFVLLGARWPAFAVPALLVVAASLGGTALGRVVGIVAAGETPPIVLGALALELGGAACALFLWKRERSTSST
jgi:hypothetical protein